MGGDLGVAEIGGRHLAPMPTIVTPSSPPRTRLVGVPVHKCSYKSNGYDAEQVSPLTYRTFATMMPTSGSLVEMFRASLWIHDRLLPNGAPANFIVTPRLHHLMARAALADATNFAAS